MCTMHRARESELERCANWNWNHFFNVTCKNRKSIFFAMLSDLVRIDLISLVCSMRYCPIILKLLSTHYPTNNRHSIYFRSKDSIFFLPSGERNTVSKIQNNPNSSQKLVHFQCYFLTRRPLSRQGKRGHRC